jgi:thioredoxin reductase
MSRTGCDDILTVSFAQWMQLPDCPVTGTMKGTSGKRITLGNVAKYFKSYIQRKNLDKYFRDHSTVTGIKFIERCKHWKVSGWQEGKGHFEYITKKVVLATGNSDTPNRLNIDGEDLPFVFHSISDMERILNDAKNRVLDESVVIVGSGLTAADAILTCKQYGIPVKHVFRRHPEDPALIFNQLPENLYPEYHMVHDTMKGSLNTPSFDYKTFPMHSVSDIRKNKEVVLTNLLGADADAETPSRTTIRASYVLVLIGKKPDLSFILNKKVRDQLPVFPDEPFNPRTNPFRIEPYSHRCSSLTGLYAMGPLVGDNFVRFVQGAALAICHDIWNEREDKINFKKTHRKPLLQVL